MEVLFCLFLLFMLIEHPFVSIMVFVGLVGFCCLGENSTSGAYGSYSNDCDCSDNNDDALPWYEEKETIWNPTYYEDGTSRYKTLTGYQYSDGTSSWVDCLDVEHRDNGTESRPVWWDDNLREIYDSSTNELLGIEREESWGISHY